MKKETVGWTVGLVTFAVILVASITYSYGRWDDNMQRARAVHPGWKLRQGTVLSQQQPNFNDSPPQVPSRVSFTDYYGRQREVTLRLVDTKRAAVSTQVDVGQDGSIYAPESFNDSYANPDWSYKGPQAAVVKFWPSVGILLFGIIGNVMVSSILGLAAFLLAERHPVPHLRGRLGTR